LESFVRKTKSIMEELNEISRERDRDNVLETRAQHVIQSAINLLEQIERHYDEQTAKDLSNRLLNSIRGKDSSKFSRGVQKVKKNKDS